MIKKLGLVLSLVLACSFPLNSLAQKGGFSSSKSSSGFSSSSRSSGSSSWGSGSKSSGSSSWGSSSKSSGSSGWGSSSKSSGSSGWSSSSKSTSSNSGWGSSSKSSSTPSSSSGWGTSSNSSSWWSSKPSSSSSSSGFTSSKTINSVDKATYDKAKSSGTVFTNKDAAVAAFKAKNESTYTSKFKEEPKIRPTYIPKSTTSSDGKTYNITYNSNYGGYGYTNPLGVWVAYDIMSDALMRDQLMRTNNYYYGEAPQTIVYTGPSHAFRNFLIIIGVVFIVVVIIVVIKGK